MVGENPLGFWARHHVSRCHGDIDKQALVVVGGSTLVGAGFVMFAMAVALLSRRG